VAVNGETVICAGDDQRWDSAFICFARPAERHNQTLQRTGPVERYGFSLWPPSLNLRSNANPMSDSTSTFSIHEINADGLDEIRPQWERLNTHHAKIATHFSSEIRRRTFTIRKAELLAKAGILHIDVVRAMPMAQPLPYCISTVSAEGIGEIDSLFVEEAFRGQGLGPELMRRALVWLDSVKVTRKVVSVLSENEEALAFYRRFGFRLRNIELEQTSPDRPS
jgi:diamine N-acetyltransferase